MTATFRRACLLFAISALVPALPKAALAEGCGQALGKPEVDLRTDAAPPQLDLSRGIQALINDPTFADARSEAFPYTLGVTHMMLDGSLRMNLIGAPRSDGTFCWSVKSLDMVLRTTTIVYIANEIPRESCFWREVKHHEEKHVAANRQFLSRLSAMVRPTVLDAVRRTMAASSDTAAKAFFETAIGDALRIVQKDFETAVGRHHREIDTPEEYHRVAGACGEAELRSALSRAGIS